MEHEWDLFDDCRPDGFSLGQDLHFVDEPHFDLYGLQEAAAPVAIGHCPEVSPKFSQQPFFASSTPLWEPLTGSDDEQTWSVQDMSPQRKLVPSEPRINTPPKLDASKLVCSSRQQPSREELVNTNLAALQESAAELLSICHHHKGSKSPKRRKGLDSEQAIGRTRRQTRSLSSSDILPKEPQGISGAKSVAHMTFSTIVEQSLLELGVSGVPGRKRPAHVLYDLKDQQQSFYDPEEPEAELELQASQSSTTSTFLGCIAPVTPEKASYAGQVAVQQESAQYPSMMGSFQPCEPFNIIQESPLAKSTTLGQLNQRLREVATQTEMPASYPSRSFPNPGQLTHLPRYRAPAMPRARSLTQISTQLAGMTNLTISKGVVIKTE